MEQKALAKAGKKLGGAISKNSPTILTCIAVGGVVSSVIFAVRATPKALEILINEGVICVERGEDGYLYARRDGTISEVIQHCWRIYMPSLATAAITVGCIIGANTVSNRRNAALAGLYTIATTSLQEYQSKVVETIGKNKELKLRDQISADHVKENSTSTSEVILTGKGEVLCYDSLCGRPFKSDIEKIRKVINDMNEELLRSDWVSLNDLYYELDLDQTKLGDLMGWKTETGLIEANYSSCLTNEGKPCLALNFKVIPKFL